MKKRVNNFCDKNRLLVIAECETPWDEDGDGSSDASPSRRRQGRFAVDTKPSGQVGIEVDSAWHAAALISRIYLSRYSRSINITCKTDARASQFCVIFPGKRLDEVCPRCTQRTQKNTHSGVHWETRGSIKLLFGKQIFTLTVQGCDWSNKETQWTRRSVCSKSKNFIAENFVDSTEWVSQGMCWLYFINLHVCRKIQLSLVSICPFLLII